MVEHASNFVEGKGFMHVRAWAQFIRGVLRLKINILFVAINATRSPPPHLTVGVDIVVAIRLQNGSVYSVNILLRSKKIRSKSTQMTSFRRIGQKKMQSIT